MRAFVKRYGPSSVKKLLWDEEFSGGKWNFIDNTLGDCIYPYLEKYSAHGCILDLGCGPGNTATELASTAYQTYVGVDISAAAIEKARVRTAETGRGGQNVFAVDDFINYAPTQTFDVILFRESMYHIPQGRIKGTIDRLSNYLKPDGVFIVRMFVEDREDGRPKERPNATFALIENHYDVVEKQSHGEPGKPTVAVFRPRRATH